jgi:preprotein translocase subunit YajC
MGLWILGALGWLLVGGSVAAFGQEASQTPALGDFLPLLVILGLFGAIFYFMLIRPQRKRQAKMSELISALKRGDNIMTAGGIIGEIDSVGDTSVVLVLEDGAKLRLAKTSIVRKLEK